MQNVIVEQYTKFAAAFQNVIQCYCIIYDQKKMSCYPEITGSFFKDVGEIQFSKEKEHVPLLSDMTKISDCWQSFSSNLSHLLSLLHTVALLAVHSDSPCVSVTALDYCTFPQPAMLNMLKLNSSMKTFKTF